MNRIKIIVNPNSGREEGLQKALQLIKLLRNDGVEIVLLFTQGQGDGIRFAQAEHQEDLVVACGGDGTIHEVVNGLYLAQRRKKLAILQCGTVNDFANYLNLPSNPKKFYQMLKQEKTMDVDLGKAGERVFINVAAGGHLTEIAYSVPDESKAVFGNMAYYLEGVKELLKLRPFEKNELIQLSLNCEELNAEEDVFFFIIANSATVGGFKKLAPQAQVADGLLDVMIVKGLEPLEVPELAASIFSGNHVEHDKIIYLKTKCIELKSKGEVKLDLDGEQGGKLPMKFEVLEKALTLVVN